MKPHEEWLYKAEHDLESACILFESNRPVLDMAIYHTQQCAEKALKGFLVWNDREVDKTHYLPALLDQCKNLDGSFDCLMEATFHLNPYSSLYRYPHASDGPSRPETGNAISLATQVLNIVKGKIT